jgi:hypothetical protein
MAKIVLRLNLREAMALWAALEWCASAFGLGKMQEKIWRTLGSEISKREKI